MNEFQFASERLEVLFPMVGVCARFGAANNIKVAFRGLVSLHQQYAQHHDTLVSWHDRCAVVSDGQTTVPGWTHCYSSAHEAALGIIRTALNVLFIPAVSDQGEFDPELGGCTPIPVTDETQQRQRFERLIAEHGKEFDFDLAWEESLKERIRRERAKLLNEPQPSNPLASLPDEATMSVNELADKLALNAEALRSRLRRWRDKNDDGWQEITDAKAKVPKFLYRVGAVRHILRDAPKRK